MAEITRPGPLAGVRPIDSATVVTKRHAAQIFGDLAAAAIKLEAPHCTLRGRERKCMSKVSRRELPDEIQGSSSSPKPSKRTTALGHTPNSAGNAAASTSLC